MNMSIEFERIYGHEAVAIKDIPDGSFFVHDSTVYIKFDHYEFAYEGDHCDCIQIRGNNVLSCYLGDDTKVLPVSRVTLGFS